MTAANTEYQPPTGSPSTAPVPINGPDPLTFVDDAPEFSAETLAALATPVNPDLVETRKASKDSDRELLFVPWVHYQAILFKAFGPGGYRLVPRAVARQEGNVVTWVGALFVRPPGSKKFQFIKEAKGECGMQGGMTPGNAAEGAQSDCLVKCCKALGIFMELFDPAWRRAWEQKYRSQHAAAVRKGEWVERGRAAGPAAPAAGSGGSRLLGPAGQAGSSAAPAPARESTAASSTGAATDTGEVASIEQLDAIAAEIKRRALTLRYIRLFFQENFNLTGTGNTSKDVVVNLLGQLTEQQAATALVKLMQLPGGGS